MSVGHHRASAAAGAVREAIPGNGAEQPWSPFAVQAGQRNLVAGVWERGRESWVETPAQLRRLAALNGAGKRLFDLLAGSVLFVLALPVMVALAVAVALSLHTWRPLFFQQRIGRGGRPFTLPKLRTLPASAPRYADKYTISSVCTTRLGRLLRATHLDELPQLFLVVTGRMSLVGPRPEMACLLAQFPRPFVAARLSVRPGCTGLWQISPDVEKLVGEVPQYDLHYVHHATARLDAWILRQTLLTLISRSGRALTIPAWTGVALTSGPKLAHIPAPEAAHSHRDGTIEPVAVPTT